jgi:hypothetical protein
MLLRPTLTIVAAALLLSACSSSDGIPSDQVVKPTNAPAGWTTTDLGPVKVSAPTTWTKGETTDASSTVKVTTWRASATGTSSSGMEVKVISKPQQNAKKAATTIAVNAMALLKGGSINPEQISWPNAKDAYYFEYDATSGTPPASYATRTVVFDLADGSQVQVTALAAKGSPDSAAPKRAVESVVLAKTKK